MFTLPRASMAHSRTFASAILLSLRWRILPLLFFTLSAIMRAQQTAPAAMQPAAGSNWAHVQALPADTKVHITTDHGSKTCRILAVSDDTLSCAKGGNTTGTVLQRSEIKQIKLAHYVRSTLVGAGIGGGIGAIAGGISGRSKPCKSPQDFCLGNLGIGAGEAAAIFGLTSGLVGGVIGGTTDLARGSSIYTRP